MRFRSTIAIVVGFLFAVHAAPAHATPEPWADDDPSAPPSRLVVGDYGFRGGAEYRANALAIKPLSLNTETDRNVGYITHRLRLDGTVDYLDKIRITTSIDALDGVIWGDNGTLGTDPQPTSGAHVNTSNPNNATVCMKLQPGRNPLQTDSYAFGVCPAENLFVRRLYGDIVTPIGLFRIGRQPTTDGMGIAVTDGDGRRNRFGFANRGNSSDRVLFATKPLEAFKLHPDASESRGTFLILAYDHLVTGNPQSFGGQLHNWITAVRVLAPRVGPVRDLEARLFHAYRWDSTYDTGVNAIGTRLTGHVGKLFTGFDLVGVFGSTREVSEAFRVITNDPPVSQAVRQFGARWSARYDRPKWSAYLEADYASGDSDPSPRSQLTQFRFAEDANVGLLLFKHVLAYQTARAAAAAVEILRSLNAPTYPVEAIDSRGAFTNALAIYPQMDFRPWKDILFRGGVLFAWAPSRMLDPIASLQRKNGTGDYVNFVGGVPGTYYGTEIDGRFQWRAMEHFAFDLEAALLFPGSALQDADHHAVRAGMVQGRTTFFF
jgi:hypothetical protein